MKPFPVSDRVRKNWEERQVEIKSEWLLVPEKLIEGFSLDAERTGMPEDCLFWMLHPKSLGDRFPIDFIKTHRQMAEANFGNKNYVLWRNEKARDDIALELLPKEVKPEPLLIPEFLTKEAAIPTSFWNQLPELAAKYGKDLEDIFLMAEFRADPAYLSELKISSARGCIRLSSVRVENDMNEYGLWWDAAKSKTRPNHRNYSNIKGELQFEQEPPNYSPGWLPPSERPSRESSEAEAADIADAIPSVDASEVKSTSDRAKPAKKTTKPSAEPVAEPVEDAVEPVG